MLYVFNASSFLAMPNTLIKDDNFQRLAEGIKPDSRNRVLLSKALKFPNATFDVYQNEFGQIVLDPRQSIPAYEGWLFQNREALESVRRGLEESAQGQVQDLGSFASFATDDDE